MRKTIAGFCDTKIGRGVVLDNISTRGTRNVGDIAGIIEFAPHFSL